MRVRGGKKIWLVALMVFVAVFLFTFLTAKFKNNIDVEAANLANFDPGYIISDYQMGNYNSMSEAEIWNFLKQKGNCNDTRIWQTGNNLGYLSESAPYSWHVSDGHYVCLADENFSGESAAHIIWQAAQDYRINPQVLIVLLQKEQGLITDSFPNSVQYRSATGYGCPDTAACSSRYYGFKNQVRNAAALFRAVLDGGWTNYPLGNNYIQYNPNSGCGGSWVNIRSLATSALYRYTPYQPNASALAAGYGAGDSCGAYGNRNFYSYFEDWFGGATSSEAASKGRTIEDGIYQLISVSDSSEVINIESGSATTNIDSRNTKGMKGQIFEIKYDVADGYYGMTNPDDGLVLDVEGASLDNGAQLIMWTQHDGCNQDWVIVPSGNEEYTIVSRCSSKVLDATIENDLVLYEDRGAANQKWMLARISNMGDRVIEDGLYQLISKSNIDKVIDVEGGVYSGMKFGSTIVYNRKKQNMDNQLFEIEYNDESGYYNIINPITGLALDVSGAEVKNNAAVGVWQRNGDCNQDWTISSTDEGDYVISSRCSSKVLDATSSNKLITFGNHGGDNQRWVLARIARSDGQVVKDGIYQLISKSNIDKVIDVEGGVYSGMKFGSTIVYNRKKQNMDNQLFEIEYNDESGYYNIINPITGLALDVSGAEVKNNAAVGVWQRNGDCNQDWTISSTDEGDYVISSRCSSKVLDATSSNKLITFGNHGGDNQRWVLAEIDN